MSSRSIGELARARSVGYLKSSRSEKGVILTEFVAATGVSRKTAIQLLRVPPGVKAKPRGRPGKRYGPDVAAALQMLWMVSGQICSKRLVPFLPTLVQMVQEEKAWGISDAVCAKLAKVSVSTCERLLHPHKSGFRQKGISMTRAVPMIKSMVPIRTWSDWDDAAPGFCEMDTVHHCDNNTSGEYVHTLCITDVVLGWTEVQALKSRGEFSVKQGVESIRSRMPYPIKALDSDGGSEFINGIMLRYCQSQGILFTRSRPYKKNDQCRVEQKNRSVIRNYVGYDRLEGEDATKALNAYYRALRIQINYLQPCMMLKSKERVGAKIRRKYDVPKTPAQRALDHPCVTQEQKDKIRDDLKKIKPIELAKQILKLREELRAHFQ